MMICESASVWVGLGLDSDRITFLASCKSNFLRFLWSAEVVRRHKPVAESGYRILERGVPVAAKRPI